MVRAPCATMVRVGVTRRRGNPTARRARALAGGPADRELRSVTATQAPVRAVARGRVSLHAVPDAFAVHLPRRGLVPRSRLIRQLERAAGTPATVIVAPAGYGKT